MKSTLAWTLAATRGACGVALTITPQIGCSDYNLQKDVEEADPPKDGDSGGGSITDTDIGGETCVRMDRGQYWWMGTKTVRAGEFAMCTLLTTRDDGSWPTRIPDADEIRVYGRGVRVPEEIRVTEADYEAATGGDGYPELEDQQSEVVAVSPTDGDGGWTALLTGPQFGVYPTDVNGCASSPDGNICTGPQLEGALWRISIEIPLPPGSRLLYGGGASTTTCLEQYGTHTAADGTEDGGVEVCYVVTEDRDEAPADGDRRRRRARDEGSVAPAARSAEATVAQARVPPATCEPGAGVFALLPLTPAGLQHVGDREVPLVPVLIAGTGRLTDSARVRRVRLLDQNTLTASWVGPDTEDGDRFSLWQHEVHGGAELDAWGSLVFRAPGGLGWPATLPTATLEWGCGPPWSDETPAAFSPAQLGCTGAPAQELAARRVRDLAGAELLEVSLAGRPGSSLRTPMGPDGAFSIHLGPGEATGRFAGATLVLERAGVSGLPMCAGTVAVGPPPSAPGAPGQAPP